MTMTTSPAGVRALASREGRRLTAYRDTRGILTVGVGHASGSPKVTAGMKITSAQCDAILAKDIAKFEVAVNAAIASVPSKLKVSQNMFDAMVSLAFNIGAGGFTGSTVVHRLQKGDKKGAADAFRMWEKPAVLKARREAERAQFLS